MPEKIVLFCNCQARKDTSEWIKAANILNRFDDIHLTTLSDLCGLCVTDSSKLVDLIGNSQKVLLIACHPRAVMPLLDQAGIRQPDKIKFFNLLTENTDALIPVLNDYRLSEPDESGKTDLAADPSWPAWYPVIDSSRCNCCGQCADFCLFGVYQKTDGMVSVVSPRNCKNNCPACARICPRIAIIFPKYASGGVISGSGSIDETVEMERLRSDTDAILGSDIYRALEHRKMKRRMVIREDVMQQAILEREDALKK